MGGRSESEVSVCFQDAFLGGIEGLSWAAGGEEVVSIVISIGDTMTGLSAEVLFCNGDFTGRGGLWISEDTEDALEDGRALLMRKLGAIGETDRRFRGITRLVELVSDS